MSGPVQSLAPGFLSLLGLKNNGALPPVMVDSSAPVIDLTRWYLQGNVEILSQSVGIGLNSAGISFVFPAVVPTNEIWYVHAHSVNVAMAAAERIDIQPVAFNRNTFALKAGEMKRYDFAGALAAAFVNTETIGDVFMPGGSAIGFNLGSYNGAAKTVFGQTFFTRLLA